MNDTEYDRMLLEELRNLRCTVRRFGVYFVVLTFLGLGTVVYGYLKFKEAERQMLGMVDDLGSWFERDAARLLVPEKTSSRAVKFTGPALEPSDDRPTRREYSAPPKFPAGTRFVPDLTYPKGYRAVNGE